jgi:hypothetical protein
VSSKPKPKALAEEVRTEITQVTVKYTTTRLGKGSNHEQRHYVAQVDVDKAGGIVWSTESIKDKNPFPAKADWLDVQEDPDPPLPKHPKDVDGGVCYYVGGMFYCS